MTVTCACGSTFQTGSTLDEIRVDICSACHPFYTGSMKFVDTQGRVDRFMKLRASADARKATQAGKKAKTAKKEEPKSLKDLLSEEKKKFQAAV